MAILPSVSLASILYLMSRSRFFRNEDAQDLVEYTLLMAFVALAVAAIFASAGGSIRNIWASATNTLSGAAGSPAGDGTSGHGRA
jgi:Flp pilus assembly pilin Flp